MGPIGNNQALIQIRAWCRIGDKPLSDSLTHICGTRGRWDKWGVCGLSTHWCCWFRVTLWGGRHSCLYSCCWLAVSWTLPYKWLICNGYSSLCCSYNEKTVLLRDTIQQTSPGRHADHRSASAANSSRDVRWTVLCNYTVSFLSRGVKNTKLNQYLPVLLTSLNVSDSRFRKHLMFWMWRHHDMARYGISSHHLAVEKGRYTRPITPREQCFCNNCMMRCISFWGVQNLYLKEDVSSMTLVNHMA